MSEMSDNLQPGTRMSDVDATVADTAEQASCPECSHDAGECTCAEDADKAEVARIFAETSWHAGMVHQFGINTRSNDPHAGVTEHIERTYMMIQKLCAIIERRMK